MAALGKRAILMVWHTKPITEDGARIGAGVGAASDAIALSRTCTRYGDAAMSASGCSTMSASG